jgi:predicted CoA-binding protein
MPKTEELIFEFLQRRRIAVAGVSRDPGSAANFVFRTLRDRGYDVSPVNPNAQQVEGTTSFPSLTSIPGELDGVVVASHPSVSADIVRQAAEKRIARVWLHRSFRQGSVSQEAVEECRRLDIQCIVGGCPVMFSQPVDFSHRCMRWWLDRRGRIGT